MCERPVVANRDRYEVFERMHWLCFHLVFEHRADADEPCADPDCPWWHLLILRKKLEHLGDDPDAALREAVDERYGL